MMSGPLVASIGGMGDHAVQLAYPFRKVAVGRLHDQVIVVRHEAPGVTEPVEPVDHLRQDAQKLYAIFVVFEDRRAPITARRDVI